MTALDLRALQVRAPKTPATIGTRAQNLCGAHHHARRGLRLIRGKVPGDPAKDTRKFAHLSHARHERFTQIASSIGVVAPMCSFPVYPTSAPPNASMPGDCAVTTRSEDMTDSSSKGLLPQLIDLLHALTEGQELLTSRVRDAMLESTCHPSPGVERRGEPCDGPRSLMVPSPDASIATRREAPRDNVDLGPGPTSASGFENGSLPEPSNGVRAAPVSGMASEETPPSDPPAAVVTHAGPPGDPSNEAHIQTGRLNSTQDGGEATAAPLNRDYNFFDELDARLAGLHNAPDGSGEP